MADGEPITARHLARLLQPYGIVSKNIRIGNTVPKCYRVDDFKDAFAKVVADKSVADNVADNVADIVENNVADNDVAANSGDVADKSGDVAANVADNLADSGIADNLADSGIADKSDDVAANVADNVADIVENNVADSDVADKSGDVAANVADRKPPVADNVVDMATRKPPVAVNVTDKLVDKIDVTDRKPVVAAISDDGADQSVAANAGNVATKVVTMTRAVVTINDHLAAPVPTKLTPKWPPPKGWTLTTYQFLITGQMR